MVVRFGNFVALPKPLLRSDFVYPPAVIRNSEPHHYGGESIKKRRTKREELEKERDLPKTVDTPKGTMLVPKPLDIDALMREIPKGKLATVDQIREKLAKDFQVDLTCPMTTGMFIRMAAEAAEEDLTKGKKRITPYWRVIKKDGSLNPKFPGGVEAQAAHLEEDGYTIIKSKGKKPPKVKDFEKYLQKL